MKKLLTRLLALGMVALMLFSVLIACGKKDDGKKNEGDGDVIEETTDENPNLPAKDFGGYEFTFLTGNYNAAYIIDYLVSEGNSGEVLDDAIARRNGILEEKYNVKICQTEVNDVVTEVRTQVMGGNVEFDAIITSCGRLATMAQENLLYNLLDIKLFNWDASYWDSNSKEQLTLGGKLYFANNALNIDTVGYLAFFNKKLISDYNLTSPFEYMKNNEWTIDNWAGLCKAISKDLDNDGNIGYMDQIGTLTQHHLPRMMLYGMGVRGTTQDETGYPRVSLMDNKDKVVNAYEKIKDVITDKSYAYCMTCSPVGANGFTDKWQYLRYLFTQDHYLFNYVYDSAIVEFANMESEFGVIPYPKYDSNQETYLADYPYNNALFALPSVMKDVDRTAAIIEDMNYYSTLTIESAWYEKLLETRYARCEDSEKSMKILRNNAVYDLALFYDFGGIRSKVLDVDPDTNPDIARNYAKWEKAIKTGIQKTANNLMGQK